MITRENAGWSPAFFLSEAEPDEGPRPEPARAAFLILLLSTLLVVSCATVIERAQEPAVVVEPIALPPSVKKSARIELTVPVHGMKLAHVRDNFHDRRGVRIHKALDMMAPRGTHVVAAADGVVAKLYHHPLGGISLYQYDVDRRYAYYYAHLDRFAPGVREGMEVKRGDHLGYVGTTGNAPEWAPHLHFQLIKLGPEGKWYRGTPVNPFPILVDAR